MRLRPPAVLLLAAALAAGCQREERQTRPDPAQGSEAQPVPVTTLEPGGQRPAPESVKGATFIANAFHLSEGKRLFSWFNCSGCHANGGGGMGPPLMDARWIYGGSVEHVHASIRDGRPNGMPAFGDRVPDDQIWELAAYVLSMGGGASPAAAPGRNDDMMARPAENRMPNAATQGRTP